MEDVNSSIFSKEGVKTTRPLNGSGKGSGILILKIKGQWKIYPQSIFIFPIWSPSGHSSMGNTGIYEKRIPI